MAKDGWYPAAIENAAPASGGDHLGEVTVGVLHTTESTTFTPREDNYFGHRNYPHFTVEIEIINGKPVFRCYQHISIRKAARALANRSGGVQTNREGCIQIEVVGSATKPFTDRTKFAHADLMIAGLGKLMRWIESQTEIPRSASVTFLSYPASYGASGARMSNAAWQTYRGWCGHQHVPENSHGDPGAIDIKALLKVGAGQPGLPLIAPSTQETDMILILAGDGSTQFLCTDTTKRRVGPAQSGVYQAGGVRLVGADHDRAARDHALSKLEEIPS